jgi:hypothetical protein
MDSGQKISLEIVTEREFMVLNEDESIFKGINMIDINNIRSVNTYEVRQWGLLLKMSQVLRECVAFGSRLNMNIAPGSLYE